MKYIVVYFMTPLCITSSKVIHYRHYDTPKEKKQLYFWIFYSSESRLRNTTVVLKVP